MVSEVVDPGRNMTSGDATDVESDAIARAVRTLRSPRIVEFLMVLFLIWMIAWSFKWIRYETQPPPTFGERWGSQLASDFATRQAAANWEARASTLPNISTGPSATLIAAGSTTSGVETPHGLRKTYFGTLPIAMQWMALKAGFGDLSSAYKLAALISIIGLGAWYLAAAAFFGRWAAIISTVAMGTSPLFLRLIDSPAGYLYDFTLSAIALTLTAVICGAYRVPAPRWLAYPALAGVSFATGLTGLGFVVWLPVVTGTAALLFGGTARAARVFATAVGAIALALGGHMLLVRRAGGAWLDSFRGTLRQPEIGGLGEISRNLDHLFYVGLAATFVLALSSLFVAYRLRDQRTAPWHDGSGLRQWLLVPALFAGGIALLRVSADGLAGTTVVAIRPLLPFLGITVGLAIVSATRYVMVQSEPAWMRALLAMTVIAVLLPTETNLARGDHMMQPSLLLADPHDVGRRTDEVRAITGLLARETRPGDVVLTDIDTGGAIPGAHPAYSYLAKVQVVAVADAGLHESRLQAVSHALRDGQQLWLFVQRVHDGTPLAQLGVCLSADHRVFRTDTFWYELYGFVPVSERSGVFDLYRVDPTRIDACGDGA